MHSFFFLFFAARFDVLVAFYHFWLPFKRLWKKDQTGKLHAGNLLKKCSTSFCNQRLFYPALYFINAGPRYLKRTNRNAVLFQSTAQLSSRLTIWFILEILFGLMHFFPPQKKYIHVLMSFMALRDWQTYEHKTTKTMLLKKKLAELE